MFHQIQLGGLNFSIGCNWGGLSQDAVFLAGKRCPKKKHIHAWNKYIDGQ